MKPFDDDAEIKTPWFKQQSRPILVCSCLHSASSSLNSDNPFAVPHLHIPHSTIRPKCAIKSSLFDSCLIHSTVGMLCKSDKPSILIIIITVGFEFCVFVAGWRHALQSEWLLLLLLLSTVEWHT